MITLPSPPPLSEAELLLRCEALAGKRLGELAEACGLAIPHNQQRHKGWSGQLLEQLLGADACSQPEPDFTHLRVELKTIPVDLHGKPLESTYVCVVPLQQGVAQRWEDSWLRRKLRRVLWLPIIGPRQLALAERKIGHARLWSPDGTEEALLRGDWEELNELICHGGLETITARMGQVLQIRPKAADSHSRCVGVGDGGEQILTQPRGYYLRPTFTAQILKAIRPRAASCIAHP